MYFSNMKNALLIILVMIQAIVFSQNSSKAKIQSKELGKAIEIEEFVKICNEFRHTDNQKFVSING